MVTFKLIKKSGPSVFTGITPKGMKQKDMASYGVIMNGCSAIGYDVMDFVNLSDGKPDQVAQRVRWIPERELRLTEEDCKPVAKITPTS